MSISKKFDLAIENNLGGVGMWALNYDGDRPELWELINTKLGITAGVDEVGNNLVKIFTNPAKNVVTISSLNDSNLKNIELYGITGKLIKEIHSSSQNINVNYLEKGMCFFKVENAQGQKESFKILKSN